MSSPLSRMPVSRRDSTVNAKQLSSFFQLQSLPFLPPPKGWRPVRLDFFLQDYIASGLPSSAHISTPAKSHHVPYRELPQGLLFPFAGYSSAESVVLPLQSCPSHFQDVPPSSWECPSSHPSRMLSSMTRPGRTWTSQPYPLVPLPSSLPPSSSPDAATPLLLPPPLPGVTPGEEGG